MSRRRRSIEPDLIANQAKVDPNFEALSFEIRNRVALLAAANQATREAVASFRRDACRAGNLIREIEARLPDDMSRHDVLMALCERAGLEPGIAIRLMDTAIKDGVAPPTEQDHITAALAAMSLPH